MTKDIEEELQELVAKRLKIEPEKVPLDQNFFSDMGLDSFTIMEVILDIEEAYYPVSLADKTAEELTTLREVAAYIDQALTRS